MGTAVRRERAVQFRFSTTIIRRRICGTLEHFWVHQRRVIEVIEGKSTWGEEKELPPVDDVAIREFAEPLVRGVLEHREEIDARLAQLAANWDLRHGWGGSQHSSFGHL